MNKVFITLLLTLHAEAWYMASPPEKCIELENKLNPNYFIEKKGCVPFTRKVYPFKMDDMETRVIFLRCESMQENIFLFVSKNRCETFHEIRRVNTTDDKKTNLNMLQRLLNP